ncbi:phage integrase SAM-like domain-containing protein [Niabella drilacis]|uniref:phage integrase SAM-like domain-containing protein n=1 Tax=Niabella drilacis (strain DSM 25811 / CCM 8410 / CCUG 62505 / LMG 26954 / E90) TaxID=1285928 RepID=UPI001FE1AACD|nr:phage integrase SAM-like domain-containing protein [Niabella drilacis]
MTLAILKQKKNKLSVYYQFDEFIKSKKRKVSKATLTVYGNVKSHLLAFEAFRAQEIFFDSFDFSFYEDFVDYLTFEHVHMRRKTKYWRKKVTLSTLPMRRLPKSIKLIYRNIPILRSTGIYLYWLV